MASFVNLPLRRFLHRQPSRVISSRNVQTASTGSDSLYPPVLPSRTAKSVSAKRRVVSEFFSRLRACAPEEKIRALSRIQRKKFVVYPQTFALNADRWYQHFTKTAYVSGLPHKSVDLSQSVLSELRSAVLSSILQEHWHVKRGKASLNKEQQHTADPCLTSIVRSARNVLVRENGLLRVCSVDLDPRVHFYWLRGERTVPKGHRSGRVEPVRFQIDDRPHSQIRVPQQLPEFVPLEEDIPAEVPVIHSAPDLLPLFRRQYDNNIFIGSKLEDPCCYGHTQFHLVPDRFHRDKMSKRGLSDQVEVFLRANGIASLFAWTGAQAMYQGFWSEEDVSRPFVSQAVITDGQYFSFFCYQLNTLALTQRSEGSNPRKNLCWGTESMRLYERVTDGEVVGWNDEVLRLLAQFLLNKP